MCPAQNIIRAVNLMIMR